MKTKDKKLIKVDLRKIRISVARMRRLRIFQWVAKARAGESTRYALQYVQINPKCIVATDGRHLNYAEGDFSEYEPGMYEVLLNRSNRVVMLLEEDAGNFPKWRDILPEHKKFFETTSSDGGVCDDFSNTFFALSKLDIMVNPTFLKDALWDDEMKCYYGEPDRPVHLSCDVGRDKDSYKLGASVMPTKAPTIKMQEVEPKLAAK